MLRYSLRQVEYLLAAAEHGSLVAAASALHVAQPTISAAIAKLEDQLGLQLLIRHHAHGVSLTAQGERLLSEARLLMRQANDLQNHAAQAGDSVEGELGIGAYLTLAPMFMPALISGFREQYPRVRITLHEGTQEQLMDGLRRGRFELALIYSVELADDLTFELLARMPPYVLLSDGHSLARQKRVSLHRLKDEPFILLDVTPSRSYFTGLLREHGIDAAIAFSSPSLELVRGLVACGAGYSLLVTRPHGDHAYDGRGLAVRPIVEPCQNAEAGLAMHRSVRPTRVMAAFSEYARAWFAAKNRSAAPRGLKRP